MKFVDRQQELAILERAFKAPGFQFIPIYGRRRIGKTRLVQEFIKDKAAIYFLADTVPESEQLRNLGRLVGEHFRDPILIDAGFKDWLQFFAYLQSKCSKRLGLVIDEFPYLVGSNAAVTSLFQKGIDQYLSAAPLHLVLMGSSIGMMEREVLLQKAPLYGRRTGSLHVRELPFDALRGFFPRKSFEDRVALYSIFGKIPAYLEKIDPRLDPVSAVENLLLQSGTFFYDEVEFLLREELREPRNYFVILRAIAQGKRKLSEITNDTGFDKSLVSKYLDTLRGLGFVEKKIPVTERYPEKSKQGIYRLCDKYSAFWFKFIFPNRSRLEIGRSEYVLSLIKESFGQHVSQAYEEVCRELCLSLMADGLIHFTQIGRWWSKDGEIDVVALDEATKTAYLGECKWSNKKVGEDVFQELVAKSRLIDWHRGVRQDRYLLFSKSGFTPRMHDLAKKENVLLVHGERVI